MAHLVRFTHILFHSVCHWPAQSASENIGFEIPHWPTLLASGTQEHY